MSSSRKQVKRNSEIASWPMAPPRLCEGLKKWPYYAREGWDGTIGKARGAYRPSGKCAPSAFAAMCLLPAVLGFVGQCIVVGLFSVFGRSLIILDTLIVLSFFLVSFGVSMRIGTGCRNRYLAVLGASVSAFLMWWAVHTVFTGLTEEVVTYRFGQLQDVSTHTEHIRMYAGVCLLIAVGCVFFLLGKRPYCEKCQVFLEQKMLLESKDSHALGALLLLRSGRIPNELQVAKASRGLPDARGSLTGESEKEVTIEHFVCTKCGQGIVSAFRGEYGTMSARRFYSERWTRNEVASCIREDAVEINEEGNH